MLLGIIADTHDRIDNLPEIISTLQLRGATQLLHAGDWKSVETIGTVIELINARDIALKGVLGNNDSRVREMLLRGNQLPQIEIVEGVLTWRQDGRILALYHGHHKPTLRTLLAAEEIDIVCLGHSHKPLITTEQNKLIVNPGSTAFAIPRSRQWHPSAALLDPYHISAELIYF